MDPGLLATSGALTEPIPLAVERLARRAVLRHTRDERRRRFPARLHAGDPAVQTRSVAVDAWDDALGTDCLLALHRWARRAVGDEPLLWVTRPGDLTVGDVDLALLRAVSAAEGELGRLVRMLVVVRNAWHDPRSGLTRRWVRLRPRSAQDR